MTPSDADGLSGIGSRASRILDRIASVLPTVRARLFALVLVALVPALVILGYDEWLARARAFDALTDLSMRVVRLMERALDDRVTRAARRLGVLAADPDIVSLSPMATRKLVDALRDDRLYNNVFVADGVAGNVRSSAVPLDRAGERARPARVQACPPHARLHDRRVPARTGKPANPDSISHNR